MNDLATNMPPKETHNFFRHFLRGAFHYGIFGSLVKICVFVNVFFILAAVEPYQYGVYKLAFSVFVTINGLLLTGLNGLVLNDVVNYKSIGQPEKAKRIFYEFFVLRILLGIISTVVFFFLADLISTHYSENIGIYLKIFSLLFFTDALVTIYDTFLRARLDFLGSNIIPFSSEITKLAIFAYFVFLSADGLNILELCIATVAGAVISVIISSLYVLFRHKPNLSIPKNNEILLIAVVRTYGKWGIIKSYFSAFVDSARLWLIKIFISTEAVAIFSIAMSLANAVKKMIPTQSLSSLVPSHVKQTDQMKDIYSHMTKYFIWVFALGIVLSFIIIPPIITMVFPKYIAAIPYFRIIIFSIIFVAMALNKQIIYSLRKQKFLFIMPIIELLSTLLLGSALIYKFGLYGISIEVIITEAIMFVVMYSYLIKIQPQLKFDWKTLFVFDASDKLMFASLFRNIGRKIGTNS